ncbi:asparagine synthase (glutamine-hydrolyzing) [Paenibacillus dendritiformis]|uniref:asparagine synthase (glutamine-hydrolyzing) n=1 Tax=Paenibacillus dendritiformis C454 TaxID=1131935 RepID=H3S9T9_9BACL|nr:asparagine synthase (glutamine-hydrolyzing) [Paenibacillus dendritiformis]EHQ64207.1 asparagine synthase [Paenibacillus dendritiformis C454]CAH8767396.1 asparagine synthase (glutamine-hydrolyzing) [Paenibacillus dendritiformis]
MCGILFTNIERVSKQSFQNALSKMIHRGPDASLCYESYNIYKYGHNRLSIVDLDARSNQPFHSSDNRYVIIYNGEIYNYKELAKEHQIRMRTNSDTELLLELYIRHGMKMLHWLNGMFSFVIIDTVKNEFFVARDRLGVKPLYYYHDEQGYIFSSEIHPILTIIQDYTLDPIAIRQYKCLRNFFNGRTTFNKVKEFPPGHYYYKQINKYWEVDYSEKLPPTDDELFYLINSSVQYRNRADVSIGSFLSGGLDSTIVTALAKPEHTWTIGFEQSNEFEWSQIAANQIGTSHHPLIMEAEQFLLLCSEIIQRKKDVISVPNEVLLYQMTSVASSTNKVILSGEGADELFFGYDRIFRWASEKRNWDVKQFSELYSYGSEEDIEIIEDALKPYSHYKTPLTIVSSFFQEAHLRGLLRRLDSASMLNSVEVRSPFLDYRLVERLAGVSINYKMSEGIIKAPLKRVFRNMIHPEIIGRRKIGFPVPVSQILPDGVEGRTPYEKWFNYNLTLLRGTL